MASLFLNSISSWIEKTQRLTQKAKYRLKVVDWYRFHRKNISLTARHFGLTRYTVRSWVRRFNQKGIMGLQDRSHRPKRLRQPTTPSEVVVEIVRLRKQYPAWSKYKIEVILTDLRVVNIYLNLDSFNKKAWKKSNLSHASFINIF